MDNLIEKIELEIEKFLRAVPFHSIFFLYDIDVEPSHLGGTCSDRSLYFKEILECKFDPSINARLHRCKINNQKTHTVILVTCKNQNYIIDVGMGFPIMKLIPCHEIIKFTAFGITFKSQIEGDIIRLFCNMSGKEQELFELDQRPQDADTIHNNIAQRFRNKSVYPFAESFRYFAIVDNKYIQIKHDNVMMGSEQPVVKIFEGNPLV